MMTAELLTVLRKRHARFFVCIMEAVARCAEEKWARFPELMN